MPYDYFDDIVCINLETRKDRREYASKLFKQHEIPCRFVTVKKHPKGGIYGCFESHIQVISEAYNEGRNNVLVFEDDLLLTDSYTRENVENAIQFMKSRDDWDIFYFGHILMNFDNLYFNTKPLQHFPNIIQYNPFTTHALVYSRRAMEKILDTFKPYLEMPMHFDLYLAGHAGLTNYCYDPILIDQKWCIGSDIKARNIRELIARKMSCFAEKKQVLHHLSQFKYKLYIFNGTFNTVLFLCVIVGIIVVYK